MPDDPLLRQLLERAAKLREHAQTFRERGDAEAAELFTERAERHERAAEALQGASQRGKKTNVETPARLRISKGRGGEKPDELQAAANAAGYTLRSLAEKLRAEGFRVSHPFLRQCREGSSAIREPLARRIEALTGFRATQAHWPKGWAKEPRPSSD